MPVLLMNLCHRLTRVRSWHDTLSTVLDGHRARGASLLRCEMRAPWSLRVQDEAALGLVVMVRGVAHLEPERGGAVLLRTGDLALVRGVRPYVFADAPGSSPIAVIEPGNVCRSLSGERLAVTLGLGTRTWGNAGDQPGDTAFLTASWELSSQVTGRLVDALPDVAVVRREDADPALPRSSPARCSATCQDRTWCSTGSSTSSSSVRCGSGSPAPTPRRPRGGAQAATPSSDARSPSSTATRRTPDARRARDAGPRVASDPVPAVHRATRAVADGLPHALAAGPVRRPAARGWTLGRTGCAGGRLRQPVRVSAAFKREHGVSPRGFRAAATSPGATTPVSAGGRR